MSDITTIQELEYKYPGLKIDNHGGACPYQAEGTYKGFEFYFRFRHGYALLRVDEDMNNNDSYMYPKYSAGINYGDGLLGVLSTSEFIRIMDGLLVEIETKINRDQETDDMVQSLLDQGYTEQQIIDLAESLKQMLQGRGTILVNKTDD